jgi:predicted nucleic-acid-binding protein
MIGLDTNVLIRLVIEDDESQTRRAQQLLSTLTVANQGYVSLIMLAELFWVLKRRYKKSTAEVVKFITDLTKAEEIAFQSAEVVHYALEASKRGADFGDALIACSCQAGGCAKTVTFDKQAAKSLGMELL